MFACLVDSWFCRQLRPCATFRPAIAEGADRPAIADGAEPTAFAAATAQLPAAWEAAALETAREYPKP